MYIDEKMSNNKKKKVEAKRSRGESYWKEMKRCGKSLVRLPLCV